MNETKAQLTPKYAYAELDSKVTKNIFDEGFITIENSNRLDLSFSNINYSVSSTFFSKHKKKLLSNVSGNFKAGELTAIMGPSGAGKTVLMDILAGFTTMSVTGDVMINGKLRNLKAFRRSSAYIMQNHVLHELLTVQESMYVAAELKLSSSSVNKRKRINALLKYLGLDEARTTYAGNLSGGQKKRLAIAMELISDLPIMFFDEPTSGLDSVTTKQCIELLKSLSQTGRTVICSIHQPSASLFNMLDNLYVIAQGRCVYTGSPRNVLPFLSSLDFYCPNYHNPADFLLEIVSGEYGEHGLKLSEAVKNGVSIKYYEQPNKDNSNNNSYISDVINQKSALELPQKYLKMMSTYYASDAKDIKNYPSSSWTQIRVLFWRYVLRTCRDRGFIMIILIAHLVMAILAGLTFQNVGQDGARTLDNVKHIIFNIIFISVCSINAALITFPAELPIVAREYLNRWYKLHSVYIANKIVGFMTVAITVSLYTLIIFFMSDQIPELNRLIYFIITNVTIALFNQALGLLLSVVLNVKNVVFFGPYVITPFILCSGMFIQVRYVRPYLSWMYDISVFKYIFEAAITAIFGFNRQRLKCSEDYCHLASPKALFQLAGLKGTSYWPPVIVVLGVYIVLHLLTYFLLRWKLKMFKCR